MNPSEGDTKLTGSLYSTVSSLVNLSISSAEPLGFSLCPDTFLVVKPSLHDLVLPSEEIGVWNVYRNKDVYRGFRFYLPDLDTHIVAQSIYYTFSNSFGHLHLLRPHVSIQILQAYSGFCDRAVIHRFCANSVATETALAYIDSGYKPYYIDSKMFLQKRYVGCDVS